MPYEFGDVVLVPFPFTNQAAAKRRPAVIVSSRPYNLARPDVVVIAVTSQLRPSPALGEVWIGHWREAGLQALRHQASVRHVGTKARDSAAWESLRRGYGGAQNGDP